MADTKKMTGQAEITRRVRKHYAAFSRSLFLSLEHAWKCGGALVEAKEAIPYGHWVEYLETVAGVPVRTAQRFMHLARNLEEAQVKDLKTQDEAVALIAGLPTEADALTDEERRALGPPHDEGLDEPDAIDVTTMPVEEPQTIDGQKAPPAEEEDAPPTPHPDEPEAVVDADAVELPDGEEPDAPKPQTTRQLTKYDRALLEIDAYRTEVEELKEAVQNKAAAVEDLEAKVRMYQDQDRPDTLGTAAKVQELENTRNQLKQCKVKRAEAAAEIKELKTERANLRRKVTRLMKEQEAYQ